MGSQTVHSSICDLNLYYWIVDSSAQSILDWQSQTADEISLRKSWVTIRFGNDNFVAITRYEDYVHGNVMICHVYYVEGLGHNLFLVGQFCDGDLEVAFCSKTYYVQNLEGEHLLSGVLDSNLYTISILDMAASSLVCLMSNAKSRKSWLWHRRLSHLNFDTIN
ncbi:integrase, catalytic region, zinc finger, CCHC-type containing protein [Tanacetum coccineum]